MKSIFNISIGLLVIFIGCKQPELGPSDACSVLPVSSHSKSERYQEVIDRYVRKGYPGISLLVRDQEGEWSGSSGMADISEGVNALPCHVFKTGSITKSMVVTMALQLIEEGYFELDDLASKYIDKEVVDQVANLDKVTVRQLMAHKTGIYDVIFDSGFYLDVINNPNKNWKVADLLAHVYGKDPEFESGAYSQYSNTNTLLLSLVVEKATGASHRRLLDDRIIKPLGLGDTYYFPFHDLPQTTAQGYYDLYNDGTVTNVGNLITGDGNGYNGIYSTVFDLRTFIEALFKTKSIISDSSLAQMQEFGVPKGVIDGTTPEAGHQLGLGVFKEFTKRDNPDEWAIGHTGGDLGNAAEMYYFPNQDATLCLLINYGTNGASSLGAFYYELRNEIVDLLME